MKFSIKDIVLIAACISIVFVQEQILSFIPNIQLTVLLLVLFSKKLGFIKTTIIVFIHSLLDCLITGSLNLYYFPFMILGWLSIPLICCTLFKKINSSLILGIAGIMGSLIYSWIFIIPNIIVANSTINLSIIIYYLVADLPFEALLACSSFLSIVWLYNPCSKVFDDILSKFYN